MTALDAFAASAAQGVQAAVRAALTVVAASSILLLALVWLYGGPPGPGGGRHA